MDIVIPKQRSKNIADIRSKIRSLNYIFESCCLQKGIDTEDKK